MSTSGMGQWTSRLIPTPTLDPDHGCLNGCTPTVIKPSDFWKHPALNVNFNILCYSISFDTAGTEFSRARAGGLQRCKLPESEPPGTSTGASASWPRCLGSRANNVSICQNSDGILFMQNTRGSRRIASSTTRSGIRCRDTIPRHRVLVSSINDSESCVIITIYYHDSTLCGSTKTERASRIPALALELVSPVRSDRCRWSLQATLSWFQQRRRWLRSRKSMFRGGLPA